MAEEKKLNQEHKPYRHIHEGFMANQRYRRSRQKYTMYRNAYKRNPHMLSFAMRVANYTYMKYYRNELDFMHG